MINDHHVSDVDISDDDVVASGGDVVSDGDNNVVDFTIVVVAVSVNGYAPL